MIHIGEDNGEEELPDALRSGRIDAVARGEVGNRDAASASDGLLTVTALDDRAEHGGFALDKEEAEPAACLDRKIAWIAHGLRIRYGEWRDDPSV